ncbi:MAG: hypothetical protein Q9M23_07475, partial [Mariprofundaceae bacterium]|nr:hypothetical protein [Mariprofundaceae bacterium]
MSAELLVRYAVRSPANEQYAANREAYAWVPYASVLRTDEGYARFKMDSMGFNNDPLPTPFPAKRLLILGDSFVQSVQVMRQDNFITHLNRKLREQNAFAYNAGLAGSDPSNAPTVFEELAEFVNAQHVLLCLSENDIQDLQRWKIRKAADGRMTGFIRQGDAPNGFGRLRGWVYAHSALITHIKFRYDPPIRAWLQEKSAWFQGKVVADTVPGEIEDMSGALSKWHFVLEYFLNRGVTVTVLVMPVVESKVGGSIKLNYHGVDALAIEAEGMGIPVLDANAALIADFRATGVPFK